MNFWAGLGLVLVGYVVGVGSIVLALKYANKWAGG